MEAGNSSRPVPAPDDMIENLHSEVLEKGSTLRIFFIHSCAKIKLHCHEGPLLEKDCAVCKEQFSLTAEADDLIIVTLPCKHPFHEGCIKPWLKSSGTCPVCR